MNTKKIATSGLVMAMYILIMYLTQSFAFMQYQIRIATSIYSIAYIHPYLCFPLSLANMLSNILMGGLGLLDIIGGFVIGLITTILIILIKKYNLNYKLVFFPIFLIPSIIVPLYLSPILGIPYLPLFINILIGQFIPGLIGIWLIRRLKQ